MAYTDVGVEEVRRAVELFDRIGREEFLKRHGFGAARRFVLVHNGREYDSKAVLGVAHGFLPGRRPLTPADFSGGVAHAVRHLRELGFEVRDLGARPPFSAEDFLAGLLTAERERPAAVALLWAVGRAADRDRPRLHPWDEIRGGLGRVVAEPERVCRGLARPDVWVVEPGGAGFAERPHERLRYDTAFRTRAVNALRSRLPDDVEDQWELLAGVGLAEHATASGSADAWQLPGRREHTGSRVVRRQANAKRVKRWHDDRCQFCDTRLDTAFGHCSQAAHIRGLGLHGGPDEPANMLCLCANCHVEFDNFALYVVDDRHLAYHRELCVIGPPRE